MKPCRSMASRVKTVRRVSQGRHACPVEDLPAGEWMARRSSLARYTLLRCRPVYSVTSRASSSFFKYAAAVGLLTRAWRAPQIDAHATRWLADRPEARFARCYEASRSTLGSLGAARRRGSRCPRAASRRRCEGTRTVPDRLAEGRGGLRRARRLASRWRREGGQSRFPSLAMASRGLPGASRCPGEASQGCRESLGCHGDWNGAAQLAAVRVSILRHSKPRRRCQPLAGLLERGLPAS